jgi:hypothetical protein
MRDSIVSTDAIEPTLNDWHRTQTATRGRRIPHTRQPRVTRHNNMNIRGTTETSPSLQDAVDSNHSCYKFKNGKTVWGNSPEEINKQSIYRDYGGNINGLKPFGEHPNLISGFKNLRKIQARGIRLIETTVEWKKYDYRANTEKLLRKTFGSTRIAYSTSDEQVEESHYKPGGTATSAL